MIVSWGNCIFIQLIRDECLQISVLTQIDVFPHVVFYDDGLANLLYTCLVIVILVSYVTIFSYKGIGHVLYCWSNQRSLVDTIVCDVKFSN